MKRILILLAALVVLGCGGTTTDSNPPPVEAQPLPVFTTNPSILVASLDGTLSVIDTTTDTVSRTVDLPDGANPAAGAYVVYSPVSRRIYVGDPANNRVVVYDVADLSVEAFLDTDTDAFHMWPSGNQLWVVDRTALSVIVFNITTNTRTTTIGIPADLRIAGGIPHDVVLDATHAYVTVLGVAGPDVVVKYELSTFQEVGRVQVGEDPHVTLSPQGRQLYVACESTDNVFVVDRDTMVTQTVVTAPGAHGVWIPPHGLALYTANFADRPEGAIVPGLIAINLASNTPIGNAPAPFTKSHNVSGTLDGGKAYVTHTNGDTKVSVYTIDSPTDAPVLSTSIDVGTDPFGIFFFPGQ